MKNTDEELVEFLKNAGIPSRYLRETEESSDFYRKLGIVESGSLFITGPVGTGKTQLIVDLVAILAGKLKRQGEDSEWVDGEYVTKDVFFYDPKLFRFYNVPKFLTDLRSFNNGEKSFSELLQELSEIKYLILDDLGVEKISEWVQEAIYVLINERYENNKQVIISSNKSIKEIAGGLGERIASRLVEMCCIEEIKGKDLRLK